MGISIAVAFVAAMSIAEIAATVAVVGTALVIAGTITKDKTMTQVGMGLGMAGGLVGLGAGLAGIGTMTMGELTTGVGDFLAGSTAAGAEAGAVGATEAAVAPTEAAVGAATDAASTGGSVGGYSGQPGAIPYNDMGTAAATASDAGAVATPVSNVGPAVSPAVAPAVDVAPAVGAPVDTAAQTYAQSVGEATNAPGTGVTELGGNLNRDLVSTNYTAPGMNVPGTGVLQTGVDPSVMNAMRMGPPPGQSPADWLEAHPALAMQMGLMGTQTLGGVIGGWFQGQSAADKLAFEKVLAGNNQTQVNRLNANNAYAPKLTFNSPSGPAGVLTK